jgi:hypothetical protein
VLSRLLKECASSGGIIDLNELSRRLDIERSALDGMLELLVRQGRLREVCGAGNSGGCHCGGSCSGCGQASEANTGKSYELISLGTPIND